MKTILISPSHFYLYQTLAVPRLTAYLKSKGHTVHGKIIDREIYNFLFSPEEMRKTFEKIKGKKSSLVATCHGHKQEIEKKMTYFSNICSLGEPKAEINDRFEWMLENEEKIIALIHDTQESMEKRFTTLGKEKFRNYFERLGFGAWLISLAYYPTTFSLTMGISMRYNPQVIEDIMLAINDKEENFLIDYYQREILPWLLAENPGLIGISMCHFSQFIPGFTLMNLIKQSGLSAHITIGGATVTDVSKFLLKKSKLWNLFDSVTIGSGECTLDELTKSLDRNGKRKLEDVPNLIYENEGEIKLSKVKKDFSIDDAVTPEFTEKRLYPYIPLETSVGCPYGKCVFCHYPFILTSEITKQSACYRERSLDLVIDDIVKLNKKYKPLLFCFTDTSISAKRLEKLAERIMEEKIDIYFWGFIRAEKEFTSLEFCQKLAKAGFVGGYFGLESASPRINKLMNKNVDIDDVKKILKNFKETNIIANIFCIIGFPTETREEALETRKFIIENWQYLTGEISLDPFYLQLNTPIMKDPAKYRIVPIDRGEDLKVDFNYKVSEGLSQEETLELLKQLYDEFNLTYLSIKFYSKIIDRKFFNVKSKDKLGAERLRK